MAASLKLSSVTVSQGYIFYSKVIHFDVLTYGMLQAFSLLAELPTITFISNVGLDCEVRQFLTKTRLRKTTNFCLMTCTEASNLYLL